MYFETDTSQIVLKFGIHVNYIENSVFTLQRTQCMSVAKTSWLVLQREVVSAYCENHTKRVNTHTSKMQSFFMLQKVVCVVTTGF